MKGNINPEYLLEVRRLIGAWLREFRAEKKLSQAELGEQMGFDQATIAKIESGKWNFGIDTLTIFAVHLDFYIFLIEKKSNDPLAELMRKRWSQSRNDN
jgi:transcriptional regulator with XRE-family HTH domain